MEGGVISRYSVIIGQYSRYIHMELGFRNTN